MSKVEINNQIVLLRKNAEQARVHVIKKLTRNAFKYRNKKGTDAQKAKNQRKASRIAKEILSVKRVKKDDLTKFALRNTLSLKEILESEKSKPVKRIKARIAHHKKFSEKIAEFKAKYPNFMEYLEPDTKNQSKSKMTKLKNNEGSENSDSKTNVKRENGSQNSDIEDSEESDDASVEDSDIGSEEQNESEIETAKINKEKKEESDVEETENLEMKVQCKSESEEEQEDNNLLCTKPTKNNKRKCSEENSNCESEEDLEETVDVAKNKKKKITAKTKKAKLEKDSEQNTEENIIKPKKLKKKNKEPKIISKEAIVKKFTDILEEKDSNKDSHPESNIDFKVSNKKIEKEVDPFFLAGNGEENYLSVALPKRTSCTNDDGDDDNYPNKFNKRKFSQEQNDKFFSKIPGNNNQRFNSNSNKPNQRWQGSERNERFSHRNGPNNKSNLNNFKDNNRDQKPFNKHSNDGSRDKKSFESKSNEILHPSWEAKKKQQEILQKGFQGKRVVFGDDS